MPSPRPPLAKAVALKSLELAVRFWPEESRHWGQALLAETHEIAQPLDALFWVLGGATVFLRSHLSHLFTLLKLPPGRTTAPLPTGNSGPRFPHNFRLVTAIVLLAISALLLLPSGREATRIVSSSWNDFNATRSDVRVVERLAAKAEQDRDARQLAFLSQCEPDPDLSEKFANRAVALDPTLFWIYASRFRRPETHVNREGLRRLQESDPDNAYVHILAAEAAMTPDFIRLPAAPDKLAARIGPIDASPSHEYWPEWYRQMEQALHASHYDSYSQRHRELSREGWLKTPEVPFSLVVYSFWSPFLPNLGQIKRYVDKKISEAQEEAAAGHSQQAEQTLQDVALFGQRMTDGGHTDFEQLGAFEVARRGQEALRNFYIQSGRQDEARAAAARLQQIEMAKEDWRNKGIARGQSTWGVFRKRAVLVQWTACFALMIAALTLLSLVLLDFRTIPWRRFRRANWLACRLADFGPPAILVLASAFLYAYRPFALAVETYRSTVAYNADAPDLIWQLGPLGLAHPSIRYLFQPSGQAALWLLFTIALSVCAAVIVIRAIWHHVAHARHA